MNTTGTVTEQGGVLIIEDDPSFAETLRTGLGEAGVSPISVEDTFGRGLSALEQRKPDVLVLDIYSGIPPDAIPEGREIWNRVWKYRFLPIVFTSAFLVPDLQAKTSHPLVKYVYKNDPNVDARQQVIGFVRDALPVGREVSRMWESLGEEVTQAAQAVLTDLIAVVWSDLERDPRRGERLRNAVRRRLRARMEALNAETRLPLLPWEQYIVPPFGDHLRAADILRKRDMETTNPEAFRVVLTPTCDLVASEGQPARVTDVLTAVCVPISEFAPPARLPTKPTSSDFEEKSRKALSPPHQGGLTALPPLLSCVPHMAVSHRRLELIKLAEIDIGSSEAGTGRPFLRVASVDSPFREQIVWAYLENAGRPGVPDRDWNTWCRGILGEIERLRAPAAGD